MAIKRFEEVTQKALEVVLGKLEEPTQQYRGLFPEQFTASLSWESLQGSGNTTVAADVIAHNASAKLKSRPEVAMASGSIPKIAILNRVSEKALHNLYALQNNPRANEQQVFNIIFGDVQRSYMGVHSRLEILGMGALSSGVAESKDANNVGITFKTTFNIPTANKTAMDAANRAWSNLATATPVADMKAVVRAARAKGHIIRGIVMNQLTFDSMILTDEVKTMYSAFIGLSNALVNPSGDQITVVLSNNGLPPIRVVDPAVAHESADGTQTIIDPWSAGKVTFLTGQRAGTTQYTLTAEEKSAGFRDPGSLAVNRDIVRITRYAKLNPYRVMTKGESVAFPVLDDPSQVYILDTINTSFTI